MNATAAAARRHAIVMVAGITLLAGWPLLLGRELAGHDSVQYLTQLAEFHAVVTDAQIPPRWAPDLDAGRGAPFFAFHPPLLLTVAELVHLAGFSLVTSINVATLTFLALAGAAMFVFARERWGTQAGTIAAAAYLFAPYTLLDLYVRHAFLEISALPFLPLALLGASRRQVLPIACAVALLLLAHPALAPLFLPGLLVYAASLRTLLGTIGGSALGVALAAWFIVPASYEMAHLRIVDLLAAGPQHYAEHFASWRQLIWSPWGYGLSLPGAGDGMSFRIGVPHLAAIVVALTVARDRSTIALAVMAAIGACFATAAAAPIWAVASFLHPIQYPWRALAVVACATAALAAAAFRRWPLTALGVILLFGAPLVRPSGYITDLSDEHFTPDRIAHQDQQVGTRGLFNPRTARGGPWLPARTRVIEGTASILHEAFESDRATIEVSAATPTTIGVQINDFPGWRAWIDGTSADIVARDGLIAVALPAGRHTMHVRYQLTTVRWLSIGVSLAGTIVAGALVVRARRRPAGSIA